MSKKSSKRNHKRIKQQQHQKKISKICYTSLICLLSITSILYLFLIVDKLTQTIYLKETLTEITALQNDVKSLEGKYSKIIKTIELKDKLKKNNDKLTKNIKNNQTTIEELEIEISKMEK